MRTETLVLNSQRSAKRLLKEINLFFGECRTMERIKGTLKILFNLLFTRELKRSESFFLSSHYVIYIIADNHQSVGLSLYCHSSITEPFVSVT